MKSKKFKTTLSLLVGFLIIFCNLPTTKCAASDTPDDELLIRSLVTSHIPDVYEQAAAFTNEYFEIISKKDVLGDEYSPTLINWRKAIFNYCSLLAKQKLYGTKLVAYFIKIMSILKFRFTPTDQYMQEMMRELDRLDHLEIYLITPDAKENAILKNIADDPNGSIQSIIYYKIKHRKPHNKFIRKIICL